MVAAMTAVEHLADYIASDAAETRRERARLARDIQSFAGRGAVRECGRPIEHGGSVAVLQVQTEGGSYGRLGGLRACQSKWLCPHCAARSATDSTAELEEAVRTWTEAGYELVLVTMTLRHTARDSLVSLFDALTDGWRMSTTGRPVKVLSSRIGVVGRVRAIEVRHGRNGWHPHIHALFFVKGRMDEPGERQEGAEGGPDEPTRADLMSELADHMFNRWSRAAEVNGLVTPNRRRGLDWRTINSADSLPNYLTKQGLGTGVDGAAVEMTQAAGKQGRRGSRSQWDIAREAGAIKRVLHARAEDTEALLDEVKELAMNSPHQRGWTPDVRARFDALPRDARRLVNALSLWREFEEGTRGKAPLTWSRNLEQELREMRLGTRDENDLSWLAVPEDPESGEDLDEPDVVDVSEEDEYIGAKMLASIDYDTYIELRAITPEVLAEIRVVAGLGSAWAAQRALAKLCEQRGVRLKLVPLGAPPTPEHLSLPPAPLRMRTSPPVIVGYDKWRREVFA